MEGLAFSQFRCIEHVSHSDEAGSDKDCYRIVNCSVVTNVKSTCVCMILITTVVIHCSFLTSYYDLHSIRLV